MNYHGYNRITTKHQTFSPVVVLCILDQELAQKIGKTFKAAKEAMPKINGRSVSPMACWKMNHRNQWLGCFLSMGWLKGKSIGNHRFSHDFHGFACNFSLKPINWFYCHVRACLIGAYWGKNKPSAQKKSTAGSEVPVHPTKPHLRPKRVWGADRYVFVQWIKDVNQ